MKANKGKGKRRHIMKERLNTHSWIALDIQYADFLPIRTVFLINHN